MKRAVTPIALGVFFVFATVITALACATLIAPETSIAVIWNIKPDAYSDLLLLRPASTIGFALISAAMAAAAYGCFHRRRWGWTLALVIFVINGLGDAAQAASGRLVEGLVGVTVAVAILWWLTRPHVRALFA